MRPRVVHLINSLYAFGGAERLICELARLSPDSPLNVIMIWDAKPSLLANLPRGRITTAVLLPLRLSELRRARAMLDAADVVHVHLSPAQLLGCFTRKPKLFTQHNSWNRRRRLPLVRMIDRLLYGRYDRIVGVSPAVTQDVMSWTGLERDRFRTILNGIDLQRFEVSPRRWSARLAEGDVRIGMAARFSANKDQECLLRALARLPRRFSLDLVGAGRLEATLRKRVAALGLEGRVRFHSVIEDMPGFYRSIDLYVQSSRFDGFSLVVAEAMASGLPTLGSDILGLRDTIGNPEQCFRCGDDKQLADMTAAICADRATYERLADRGVVWASSFSSSRMAKEYGDLYEELAGAGGRAPLPWNAPLDSAEG